MYEAELRRVRQLIRSRLHVVTLHAQDEMAADNLTISDVRHAIRTGLIIERQKDQTSGEWKYVIQGESQEGWTTTVVAKISVTGKAVIITVFRE